MAFPAVHEYQSKGMHRRAPKSHATAVAAGINRDVERVIALLNKGAVVSVDRARLMQYLDAVPSAEAEEKVDSAVKRVTAAYRGAGNKDKDRDLEFNLSEQMKEQLSLLSAIKEAALAPDGSLNVSLREAATLLSATDRVMNTIAKLSDQLKSDKRLKVIEEATIELVKKLPEEQQNWFFAELHKKLAGIK